MSSFEECPFNGCDGCRCHMVSPCDHCTRHTCEHEDGGKMCEDCYEKET